MTFLSFKLQAPHSFFQVSLAYDGAAVPWSKMCVVYISFYVFFRDTFLVYDQVIFVW